MHRLLLLSLALGCLFGCAAEEKVEKPEAPPKEEKPADVFADNRLMPDEVTPAMQADMDKKEPAEGEEVVVFDTSKGQIVVMLYGAVAPKTVENFKKLAADSFYDGTRFHRCIPGFMIQGGDPNSKSLDAPGSWGSGGPDYMIRDELNPIAHTQGVLSMAHAGPNTGGSQFFIMDGEAPHLDYVHTAFGRVVKGQDVVAKIIATGPTEQSANGIVEPSKAVVLKKATVQKWPLE
jgi:cyclophilin family peptidyl-prolyl cis-trans isomerase